MGQWKWVILGGAALLAVAAYFVTRPTENMSALPQEEITEEHEDRAQGNFPLQSSPVPTKPKGSDATNSRSKLPALPQFEPDPPPRVPAEDPWNQPDPNPPKLQQWTPESGEPKPEFNADSPEADFLFKEN